ARRRRPLAMRSALALPGLPTTGSFCLGTSPPELTSAVRQNRARAMGLTKTTAACRFMTRLLEGMGSGDGPLGRLAVPTWQPAAGARRLGYFVGAALGGSFFAGPPRICSATFRVVTNTALSIGMASRPTRAARILAAADADVPGLNDAVTGDSAHESSMAG